MVNVVGPFFAVFLISCFTLFSRASSDPCFDLYILKGLSPEATSKALECYYKTDSSSPIEKAQILNQKAYLLFFQAEHEVDSENKALQLEKLDVAMATAKEAAIIFGPFLDFDSYRNLANSESRLLSRSLYLYSTILARISSIQGPVSIISQWPEIQKILKMVLRLKNSDIEFYGAHRTLAIANSRLPAGFGDKKTAEQFFQFAIQNTLKRDGLSAFIDNTIYYAELLWITDKDQESCQLLKLASEVTDAEIGEWAPLHIFESQLARKNAALEWAQKCEIPSP